MAIVNQKQIKVVQIENLQKKKNVFQKFEHSSTDEFMKMKLVYSV